MNDVAPRHAPRHDVASRPVRRLHAALAVGLALGGLTGLTACSDDGGGGRAQPRVDWIAPALEAIEVARGEEPALLEVAATLESVDVIVREGDGQGVGYRYDATGLTGPADPRQDLREPFGPDDVTIDPDRIFDGIRAGLDDPTIVDLAIRSDGGAVVIDATVASDAGGLLLVLLGPQGAVLGTQPA